VAAVDPATRRIVARAKLGGPPDYVRWVAPTHEVWVTEPARQVIEIFRVDAGSPPTLTAAGTIAVPAGPESLVVDSEHGRAYTNTFGDATVALDVRAHSASAPWSNGCGGARGIALDAERQWVFVGCDEGRVVALDATRGGEILGTAKTGGGVDGIAYDARRAHLYVPGGDAATLTFVGVRPRGALDVLGTVPIASGAHCVAADDGANVYVCDPKAGALLVVVDPYPASR
jgi:DNA-binding beta-propeller fold protein YncE